VGSLSSIVLFGIFISVDRIVIRLRLLFVALWGESLILAVPQFLDKNWLLLLRNYKFVLDDFGDEAILVLQLAVVRVVDFEPVFLRQLVVNRSSSGVYGTTNLALCVHAYTVVIVLFQNLLWVLVLVDSALGVEGN